MRIDWLAPREREVAGIVYSLGEASAVEVGQALSDPLSNAAVRSMLTRLEAKGVVRRQRAGKKFYYAPAAIDPAAQQAALRKVASDYFGGSLFEAAAALVALARAESKRPSGLRAA